MADINLLPEELRDKEKRELAAEKKAKDEAFKLALPLDDPASPKPKAAKPLNRWGAMFGKKQPPAADAKAAENTTDPTSMFRPVSTEPVRFKQRPDLSGLNERSMGKRPGPVPLPPPPIKKIEPATAPDLSERLSAVTNQFKPKAAKHSWFSRKNKPATVATPSNSQAIAGRLHAAADIESSELDVNLIPAEMVGGEEQNLKQRFKRSGMIVALAIGAVGLAYAGILWYNLTIVKQVNDLNQSIQQLENEIASNEAAKVAAVDLQQRLKLVNDLLNHHVYWTKFFDALEQYTIDEVYYSNFAMAGTSELTLSAVGRDYESVARQLVAFQEASNFVTKAEVNSALASLDDNGNYEQVSFMVNLTLQPQVFLQSTQ